MLFILHFQLPIFAYWRIKIFVQGRYAQFYYLVVQARNFQGLEVDFVQIQNANEIVSVTDKEKIALVLTSKKCVLELILSEHFLVIRKSVFVQIDNS